MESKSLCGASPLEVVRYLSEINSCSIVFFDSGKSASGKALWSIVTCEPSSVLTEQDNRFVELPSGRHVIDIHAWMTENNPVKSEDSACQAPFQGGLAGFLGFELAWFLGGVNAERKVSNTPLLWVGVFEAAACYDHTNDVWILTGDQNSPVSKFLQETIENASVLSESIASDLEVTSNRVSSNGAKLCVTSSEYEACVATCIDAIRAGELQQVNFTERFVGSWQGTGRADGFSLFEALRLHENGAYGGFLQADVSGTQFSIASVSPEQFLAVEKRRVTTRPIKGTRRRGVTSEEDEAMRSELLASEKDRGENQLIVELMHEDLAKVCIFDSLRTSAFCALESFEGVHHLVSTVEGALAPNYNALDAFLACFPAGSCVGAPRDLSMEFIARLESSARGPYTGSMFYWSKDGRLDSNVLIRTAVLTDFLAYYGAGGAVVLDSEPHKEYMEATLKARPFLIALNEGSHSE